MSKIKLSFWGLLLALSALWLFADTLIPDPFNYFSFRGVFVQYTGVVAIGVMSAALLLALRPKLIERPLNGLDKMYRLHKWLGVTALVVATVHWWWAKGTKWMVGWGWLTKPERKPVIEQMLSAPEELLRSQRGLAESVGEWVFYIVAILIVLALIKKFPYHLFRKTHNWLAIAYLALVFHTVVLTQFSYWSQPVGWVLAILMLGGTMSALLVLAGQVGARRKAEGVIESVTYYPGLNVIEGTLDVGNGWQGHVPGQFAFVISNKREGAHPYTIASAWNPEEHRMTFITKGLGDWTSRLRDRLKVGTPVSVEGPYGCFDFNDGRSRQIWIGGGIGITPFIARMKHLAHTPGEQEIDLFHATTDFDQTAIDKLTADAEAANVKLHLFVTPKDSRLTGERIRKLVPEWRSTGVWFCGPAAFGDALREDFLANGLPAANFHREFFEMR
ncbi:MAG: ferric reductase-like transmembrane domain-containing protein [Pseudomonadales bacterium]|nr:ferric reductase-like transmembrane domain-containing protein [Pseudomonadales bacterium]